MPYSTNAQVASEFKQISFGASTPVTETEADRFITESDQEIDSMIGSRYSTPVSSSTSPLSIILLRQLSIWLTADRVARIYKVKIGVEDVNQEGVTVNLRQRALDVLEKIKKGEIKLSDATAASTQDGLTSYNAQNSTDTDVTPTFEARTDQW